MLHLCHVHNLEYIGKEALSGLTNLEQLHMSDNIKLTKLDQFALAKVNKQSGGSIWPQLKTVRGFLTTYRRNQIVLFAVKFGKQ